MKDFRLIYTILLVLVVSIWFIVIYEFIGQFIQ
jgi:hypothetical protein